MRAVLIAAGRSKRLWPIGDKNFLSFMGKPLIWHQINVLKSCGMESIIVVGGVHNLSGLQSVGSVSGNLVTCVEQIDLETGMAGAVLSAKHLINSEPFLFVSSNDVVEQHALDYLFEKSSQSQATSLLLGKKVREYFPGGYVDVDSHNRLKRIVEKPGEGNEPSDMVNIVMHVHKNPALLFEMLENTDFQTDGKYEEALNCLVRKGNTIEVVPYDGFWQPIKYPWHILPLARFLFNQTKPFISKSSSISPKASIDGAVFVDDDVRIFDYAVISGPCYLGKGTIVGNFSLVRDSFVGNKCVIGFSSEVARSYVGDGVWLHKNYVGDSVIGDNCAFGSGTVTGNLRLDEEQISVLVEDKKMPVGSNKFGLVAGTGVRVGINTSFMPGVKVGSNSFVGAGIVVAQDIPENMFVTGTWDLRIHENRRRASIDRREHMRNSI